MIRDRIKELRRVKASELRPNPRNWRTHPDGQRAALSGVLTEIGYAGALLAREADGGQLVLIDGHLRAETTPDQEVPVLVLDVTEAEADKLLAVVDPIGAMATVDAAKLESLLAEITTDDAALQAMLDGLAGDAGLNLPAEIVEDEAPAPPVEPITRPGDLWILGEHRLLCGDCREPESLTRLLGESQVNLVITSPPYAEQREYDQSSGFKPIPPDAYVAWFEGVQGPVRERMAPDGSFFLNIKPASSGLDTELYVFDLVLAFAREWGWHFATEFCWERNGVPKCVTQRFKNQFEPVYQFTIGRWKMRPDSVRHESASVPRAGGKGVGDTSWATTQGGNGEMFGGDRVSPGLAYPGNRLPTFTATHEALGHAAAFPVGLPAFFINAYSDHGDVVYEPFCGSGSTLIAAEHSGRRCCAMELSPAYCDVIVTRWEKLTGGKAVCEPQRELATA